MTEATENPRDNVAKLPLAPSQGPASQAAAENWRARRRQPFDFHLPFHSGWVWLTGAGPGDPGLLTLHAWHAIQGADIIYYDALVSEAILEQVPDATNLVYVGKRGGVASPKQAEITGHLITSANAGHRVLRLKGGDPFVFGRGAEEAQELNAAGIPFRIIPGVSAGIGGIAYAGIPVTHRDFNQGVTLITAHGADGELSTRVDWNALATSTPVLVIYMGFRLLEKITARLIAGGRAANTPVGIVCNATMPEQRTITTTLGNAATDATAAGLGSPAMIVVGDIVTLREELDWLTPLTELGPYARSHVATGT